MPGFNQTGPMGQGPLTGRRMGRCTNYGTTRKNNDTIVNENQTEREQENLTGRGFQFGFGRGRGGRGRGMGFRYRFRGGF